MFTCIFNSRIVVDQLLCLLSRNATVESTTNKYISTVVYNLD